MRFSVVFALTGVGLGVLIQLLPTWFALRFGVSEDEVGLWIGLANAASIIAIPLIPRLVEGGGYWCRPRSPNQRHRLLGGNALRRYLRGSGRPLRGAKRARGYGLGDAALLHDGRRGERERATTTAIAFTAWGVGATVGTFVGGAPWGRAPLPAVRDRSRCLRGRLSIAPGALREVQASRGGLTWTGRVRISSDTKPRINRTEKGK